MADEVAQTAPLLIRSLLQGLVEPPVGREGDPLRSSAQQFNSHWTRHGSGCSRSAGLPQNLRGELLLACSEGYGFAFGPGTWLLAGLIVTARCAAL